MKIYISADMEGVAGVVTEQQLAPEGFEYERFREFMTAEVNTAIQAARENGATEIIVSDSHGNGQNLLIERFPKDVSIVRSWPRPLLMVDGIDATFAGVILLGYHTSTHNCHGVRAHTMSSARFAELRLNGKPACETTLSAAMAGHFGVPVILVTGDDKYIEEAQSVLGDVEGAVVKWAGGFHSARVLTPDRAREIIDEATARALQRIQDFKPFRVTTPVSFELRFKHYRPAEVLSYLPIVERVDSHTIRYVGKDIVEVARFLGFVMTYEPGLQP